jgi:hypothetical protein
VTRTRSRKPTVLVAGAAVLAACAGLLSGAAPQAVADTVPSVTLPGPRMAEPRAAGPVTADGSGYLSSVDPGFPDGRVSSWVPFDGPTREDQPGARAFNDGNGLEAGPVGSDGQPPKHYVIRHYATGDTVEIDIPSTDTATHIFHRNGMVTLRQVGGKWTMHMLQVPEGGGPQEDHPLTNVPDDMGPAANDPVSDSRGAAFWYNPQGGGASHTELLDFATGRLTQVPSDGFRVLESRQLTADKALFLAVDKTFSSLSLYVLDRNHPEQPGTRIDSLDGDRQFLEKMAVIGD